MASRTFVAASSQYLSSVGCDITGFPFTLAAKFRVATATTDQTLMSIGKNVTGHNYACMYVENSGVRVQINTPNFAALNANATAVANNTWHIAVARFNTTTARIALSTRTTAGWTISTPASVAIDTVDADMSFASIGTYIGGRILDGGGLTPLMDGEIEYAAIFDYYLPNSWVEALVHGIRPDQFTIGAPVNHWLFANDDTDEMGNRDLTPTNTPTFTTGAAGDGDMNAAPALTAYNHSLDVSGKTDGANPTTDLTVEPVFPASGGAATVADMTYADHGSTGTTNGFTIAAGADHTFLIRSFPGWLVDSSFWNPRFEASVTFEASIEASHCVLVHFYDADGDTYTDGVLGAQGAGILAYVRDDTGWQVDLRDQAADTGGSDVRDGPTAIATTAGNFAKFRMTLTISTTGPHLYDSLFEEYSGGTWNTLCTATGEAAVGCRYALAFRPSSTEATKIRNVEVDYLGQQLVVDRCGQSELAGRATDYQATPVSAGLVNIGRSGAIGPMADPAQGEGVIGWAFPDDAATAGGSFMPTFIGGLSTSYSTIISHGIGDKGGSTTNDHQPPAATAPFTVSDLTGAAHMMNWLLAGDGSQIPIRVLYYLGTSDMVAGTIQATIETEMGAIFDRYDLLFPTNQVWLINLGDRTYFVGCTQAECVAVRAGIDAVVAARSNLTQVADDATWVGTIAAAAGTGWPNSDDSGDHPGKADNDLISAALGGAILPPAGAAGKWSKIIKILEL